MPLVSVIVPCYNEQDTIGLLLEAIATQTLPCADLEVIVADGRSSDQTRGRIDQFRQEHPEMDVRVVENPRRNIPSGLNCALAEARGEYIVRLDAHSIPARDYLQRSVEDLTAGKGEMVGGVWEIRPRGNGVIGRAIAVAAAHPLGVGDALYRFARQAGYVDTVPFGAYHRDVIERIGKYDETLLANEDYEFNTRLRRSGGRVWLDPSIRSVYFARANLRQLARQYFNYGYWKLRMLRRYPTTLRLRQALPPAFVLGVVLLALVVLLAAPARAIAGGLLLGGLVVYALALIAGSVPAARREKDARLVLAVPLAIAVMHFSWGSGFWASLLKR